MLILPDMTLFKDSRTNHFLSDKNLTKRFKQFYQDFFDTKFKTIIKRVAVILNFEEGIEIALNTIKNGDALKLLENFVRDYGDITKLKEFE